MINFQCYFVHLVVGVYTKNRNFRLYKSSKLGKNSAFVLAEDNEFVPKPDKHLTKEESIFQASLISNVRYLIMLTWIQSPASLSKAFVYTSKASACRLRCP